MPSFNRVTLIGNLTRDPQIKHLPTNTTVADFGLAMSRRYKTQTGEDREEVCFIDCSAFGKQADVIGQYCKKGRPLFVEGRLKYDTWDDKMGGGRRSKVSVVVENFQFLGSRDDNAGSSSSGIGQQKTFDDADQKRAPKSRQPERSSKATARQSAVKEDEGFTDADIPF
jgi:single-strand DNA-binding protein